MNKAAHRAIPMLESLSRAQHGGGGCVARVGAAVAVELPLHAAESERALRWLIHVRCPNMNPLRPDCLDGDYERGCELLAQSYTALFAEFAKRL
mmetsp:Transcript_29963/g.65558  ORF Transcript_29963/g.65558 Transcript_29963/m.65558 type:complete len:94 (+) Transcript_29963:659-940(+)